MGSALDFQKVETKARSSITYRELRLQGFNGTRYDAEMLIAQGLPHFQRDADADADADAETSKPDVTSSPAVTPEVTPSATASPSAVKTPKEKVAPRQCDADLTVTVRSLRNTPSRLRARCERGRIISDCSSSGISDDASSSSSGSDRDSGIEMSSSNDHVAIERGVQRLNLNSAKQHASSIASSVTSPPATAAARFPVTPPNAASSHHVKLTLRMKRSPVLDEVIACGKAMRESSVSPGKKLNGLRHPDYEVVRMEGLDGHAVDLKDEIYRFDPADDPEVSFTLNSKDRGRHHRFRGKRRGNTLPDSSTPDSSLAGPKTKRLRLVLGNETVSTIDLNSIN